MMSMPSTAAALRGVAALSAALLAAASPLRASCAEAFPVPWLDLGYEELNPVARSTDKLKALNGSVCAESFDASFDLLDDGGVKVYRWRVSQSAASPSKGWATTRTFFAKDLQPRPDGLRLRFKASKPLELELSAFGAKEEDPMRKRAFYGEVSTLGRKSLRVGEAWSETDVLFASFVPEAKRALTKGFGFSVSQPVDVEFAAIDLLYSSKADADKALAARAGDKAAKLKLMLDWLSDRGLDLKAASNGLPPERLERSLWDGAAALALKEQAAFWSSFLAAKRPASLAGLRGLAPRLASIEAALKEGRDAHADLGSCQAALDKEIDVLLKAFPPDERRFRYDEAARLFRSPDGKPYRMYGPFFFRSIYSPAKGNSQSWRPWDFRYLAALGFNGIRVDVQWNNLEPVQGSFNKAYLDMVKAIMAEAERYGFGVSVDLHWQFPEWFVDGKPGMPPVVKTKTTSYHWPEAVQDAWRRLAVELKDVPNIVAFEVPTNETPLAREPLGIKNFPELMRLWNQWLKERYGTRERLNSVWGAAAFEPQRYALSPEEDWDKASVQPLGFQGDSSPDMAYERNPRMQDHLAFAAWIQRWQTGAIMKEIRKSVPGAVGMFQRTIGDMWDKSPVPIDYHAVMTCVSEGVLPGTHYDMGGVNAMKAATLSLGSYDSEQQMENGWNSVRRHVELGLGFCPFAFHAKGGGGMLLSDDDWFIKPEVAYLPKKAAWIKSCWPEPPKDSLRKIAVVANSRLAAGLGDSQGALLEMLAAEGFQTGVFESMRLVQDASPLEGYDAVVTSSGFMDLALLDALASKFKGKVLLKGRLDLDAYVRRQDAGLPAALAKLGVFLKKPELSALDPSGSDSIDLCGSWDWSFTGEEFPPSGPPPNSLNWEAMPVPRLWGETGMTGSRNFRLGYGWYRRSFEIPESLKGSSLVFRMGAVDDVDWAFFNGKLIGHIGEGKNNYWTLPRFYKIPEKLVKWGGSNTLTVCVKNLREDGGIWKKPVDISTGRQRKAVWSSNGAETALLSSGKATLIPEGSLNGAAETLASVEGHPAMLRQGRWLWWIGDQPWDSSSEADKLVVKLLSEELGGPARSK